MRKLNIGLTDTYYEQVRVIIRALGGEPCELVTSEQLGRCFAGLRCNPTGSANLSFEHQSIDMRGVSVSYWTVPCYESEEPLDSYIMAAQQNDSFSPQKREFLAPLINMEFVADRVSELDGLLLAGGEDVNPRIYGEPCCGSHAQHRTRDIIELAYVSEAVRQRKPILGLCRGSQLLAVALGEKLVQDIPSRFAQIGDCHGAAHESLKSGGHEIAVTADAPLARYLKVDGQTAKNGQIVINVNSYHHQAVVLPVRHIKVQAVAVNNDKNATCGLVEGFVAPFDFFVVGAQWHPERPPALGDGSAAMHICDWELLSSRWRPHDRALFESFMAAARATRLRQEPAVT